jgi:hypothetical protein
MNSTGLMTITDTDYYSNVGFPSVMTSFPKMYGPPRDCKGKAKGE